MSDLLSLLFLLSQAADAFPGYGSSSQEQGHRSVAEAECPMGGPAGPGLEGRLAQRDERLAAWEGRYPAAEYGRKYTPGTLGDSGEVPCEGAEGNLYCNKIHGEWGDSIPQDGKYCIWAILEFQDPPEFNMGTSDANRTEFISMTGAALDSIMTGWPDVADKVVALSGAGGESMGDQPASVPWPTSTIIFKYGNKYAKPWITDVHRTGWQGWGYGQGFTGHMNLKAVECDKIWPTLEANGLTRADNFTETMQGVPRNLDGFLHWWNAFHDMEEMSAQFKEAGSCVGECLMAPCPPEDEFSSGGEGEEAGGVPVGDAPADDAGSDSDPPAESAGDRFVTKTAFVAGAVAAGAALLF